MSTNDAPAATRFEQVRQILRDAAGGRDIAYGGQALWQYSRDRLLEATLYGIRLIAPEIKAAGSCCDHHTPKAPSRGASSGLILGLRGQGPFDGSQFPPLPWGGEPVAERDIQVISDWINDGCPADDAAPGIYNLVSIQSKPISITVA